MMSAEMKTRVRTIRGLKTGWLVGGNPDGDIILCLHGFPDGPETWSKQWPAFLDKYQIIAPFNRGLWPSEPASDLDRYSPEAMVLDIQGILEDCDQDGRRPISLLCHDLGVVYGWAVARGFRSRVRDFIAISGLDVFQMRRRNRNLRQQFKSWYIRLMKLPILPELFAEISPLAVSYLSARQGREVAISTKELSLRMRDCLNQYRAFMKVTPCEDPIQVSPLVIFGSNDVALEPPTMDEFEGFVPSVTVRILDGGHWIHQSRSDQVNEIILQRLLSGAKEAKHAGES